MKNLIEKLEEVTAVADPMDGDEEFLKFLELVLESVVPKEGKARALTRINDAAKRGGIDKAIKATLSRIKATKDAGKMEGIVAAVEDIIDQLLKVKKAAEAQL